MKVGIFFSVTLSLLIVGGSLWYRLDQGHQTSAEALVSKGPLYNASELREFTNLTPATSTPVISEKGQELTTAEAIGHNLIAEYVTLAATGEATDDRVTAIASNYIENLPNLLKPETITLNELKIVPDSTANFRAYATTIQSAHQIFSQKIALASQNKSFSAETTDDLYVVMNAFNREYSALAQKLKATPVPQSLTSDHLDLINFYLSTATAAKAVTEEETDSAAAFAGLVTFKQNVDNQDLYLAPITKILNAHGI